MQAQPDRLSRRTWLAGAAAALLMPMSSRAAAPRSVYLDELTWVEVRDAIRAGCTTAIIPVGGTEQSGPHIALGKHNARAQRLAGLIASRLGNALVAPVLAYAPEGSIDPPSGHMRFAGTISVPDAAFRALLAGAARSLLRHGFDDVVLIGDHGDYQPSLAAVAAAANRAATGRARVHHIADYYRAAQIAYADALRRRGISDAQIGRHAGTADTALTLALAPSLVQASQFDAAVAAGEALGTQGDPRAASASLGQTGVELIVAQSVAAIRQATAKR